MATYSRQPTYAAALETAKELSKKKDPNAIRTPTGVNTISESEKALGQRAQGEGTKLQEVGLDFTPTEATPTTPALNADDVQTWGTQNTVSGRGTGNITKSIDEQIKKVVSDNDKKTEEDAKALDTAKEAKDEFVDNAMNSTTAMGEIGTLSAYQSGDLQLAKMMADPTTRTTDIGVVSQMLPTIDPRLRALASQVYQGELNLARGQSAAELSNLQAAQAGADTQIEGMLGSGEEARTRLQDQYGEATTALDTAAQERDQAAIDYQNEMNAALEEGIAAGNEHLVTLQTAKDLPVINNSDNITQSIVTNPLETTNDYNKLSKHYTNSMSGIQKLQNNLKKPGISDAAKKKIESNIQAAKAALQDQLNQIFETYTEGIKTTGFFGGGKRDRSEGVEWQTSDNARKMYKVYKELKSFLSRG